MGSWMESRIEFYSTVYSEACSVPTRLGYRECDRNDIGFFVWREEKASTAVAN